MAKWWREETCVPEYVNRLEDGQKKAARALVPISDEFLTGIATSSILAENSFMAAREKWDERPSGEKTWKNWKNHFADFQSAIELATHTSGGSFGSANSAAKFHGTSALHPADDEIPSSTVKKLYSYLDNIAVAATNKRDMFNRLVANN